MYLREVKRRNKEGAEVVYYQLAESVYDKARRQARVRVVHTFGRADEVDAEALRRLSSSLLKACGPAPDPPVETERTYDLGLVHVVGTLWENLGVGPALRRQMAEWKRHKHPFDRILMALTAYRLDDPVSKRGCYEYWLPERVWMPESSAWKLEEFYRAMDFYRENADALEEELLRNHCTHFGSEVDLVFLDLSLLKIVTGEVPTGAASFASPHQNVRSAAVKFWAGIAVSRIGVPIQTWVFPETTPQETALACMEADLRRSGLVRLVCIGEAAEVPGKPGPRSHIRAVPMWGAREVKESVLARPGRYRPMSDSLEVKEVLVNSGGHRRRYILCRNPEEAQRRTQWRAWVLKLLEAELQALDPADTGYAGKVKELRGSQLFGGYLRENRAKRLLPDAVKISREARMDGKCVLTTNDDTLTAEEVALSDQAARVAEEFFRQARTMGLRSRPMFHWSPHRIEAHVRLCAIFIVVQRYAELRTGASWERLRRQLEPCKAIRLRMGDRVRIRQTLSGPELQATFARLGVPAEAPLALPPPGP